MDAHLITALGDELFAALRGRHTLQPLTSRYPDLTLDQAYRISLAFLQRREALGERVVGKKIGVTSRAVQEMLDVHQPDFGFLTDAMQVADGGDVSLARHQLIQPRAEGEIAFILGEDLHGPGISAEDVLAATQSVMPCFEIVDSRIDNWQIRIQDTVADNASCGVFALGTQRLDPRTLDLAKVQMQLLKNGQPAGGGLGSAVQGHPCAAVAWLANTLGELGIPFRRGEIILSGALAPLVPVAAGDRISLSMSGLGQSSLRFVP
ncbi:MULTISPECIES: fumarylacetoacetate hydrolase family protein [Pseudomonas]|uniref:2-oxopent-4-enoate hydratase n=3 Tax=Pseudomonas TaxID=286 RepID=A0A2R7UEY3_PSEDL|nr:MULTISPECIES: fumarylacetoacetate hydrolase family protein [Pseudomonas]MRF40596.1 2-oxopent-4-enoate hydratase [Escherichia coli]MBF8644383.1 fumarylacetoacetate hydrolase family protein [Pseudomonas pudica]MBF8701334.1 fumarylacetoacetate hydrolase family protein [Pseudomonas putida]MBF8707847.1 fumarylacetoacetate hydrolase family protein [Pseudomonas putida]MBF8735108.1 fumarylacetoacetate hydrolase family protein [Pseudomonas putida]